jgi:hypothetical protein
LQDPNATIGQIDGFSEKDILRLERMYENETYDGNSSYTTPSQVTIFIIITLNFLTQLQ